MPSLTAIPDAAIEPVADLAGRILGETRKAVVGKGEVAELMLAAMLAGGHVLIEDVPGVGKTTLARAMAHAFGGTTRRIQFTPDLLPSDVTGITYFDQKAAECFEHPSGVFPVHRHSEPIGSLFPGHRLYTLNACSDVPAMAHGRQQPED